MTTLPGFTADASLNPTLGQYRSAMTPSGLAGTAVMPQMAAGGVGLTSDQLYWCRLACLYCHYTGYYCWTCFICALIISVGW